MRNLEIAMTIFMLLGVVVVGDAFAQSESVIVYGPGTKSCGYLLSEKTRGSTQYTIEIRAWLAGFVTGNNLRLFYEGDRGLRRVDFEGMEAWVEKYCREKPLDSIFHAAEDLAGELRKPK